MNIRLVTEKDIVAINEIHARYHMSDFESPDLLANVGSVLVEDEKGIIGAGILKPQVEAVMILDLSRDLRTKSSALTEMIKQSIVFGKKFGMPQIHAFVQDPEFATELIKHYGFRIINRTSLVMDI